MDVDLVTASCDMWSWSLYHSSGSCSVILTVYMYMFSLQDLVFHWLYCPSGIYYGFNAAMVNILVSTSYQIIEHNVKEVASIDISAAVAHNSIKHFSVFQLIVKQGWYISVGLIIFLLPLLQAAKKTINANAWTHLLCRRKIICFYKSLLLTLIPCFIVRISENTFAASSW